MSDLIKGRNFVIVPKVTTTERNALTATNGMLVYDTTLNKFYCYQNSAWTQVVSTGGGGSVSWGDITGVLSNQTDLNNALAAKASAADLTNHISNTSNPHTVTKAQVGLGDVPNTDTTNPANITQSSSYRFVTDTEKSTWNGKQDALGYTAENSANKTSTITGNTTSTTLYSTIKGIVDWMKDGLAAVIPAKATALVDADTIHIFDSEDSNKTKTRTFAQIKSTLKTYFDALYSNKHVRVGTTATTVQGTSTETIVQSFLIDANYFKSWDGMSFFSWSTKSAQTANDTWTSNVYFNTSNSLVGATAVRTPGNYGATQRYGALSIQSIVFTSNTTIDLVAYNATSTPSDAVLSTSTYSTITIPNITSSFYIIITLQHTGSNQSDTLTHRKTVITKEES